jgi:hypothetical protein
LCCNAYGSTFSKGVAIAVKIKQLVLRRIKDLNGDVFITMIFLYSLTSIC